MFDNVDAGRIDKVIEIDDPKLEQMLRRSAERYQEIYNRAKSLTGVEAKGRQDLQVLAEEIGAIPDVLNWLLGDEINKLRDDIGALEAYRGVRDGLRKSRRWSFELGMVAATFPAEMRFSSVDWNIYRACANTNSHTPSWWLYRAIREELNAEGVRHFDQEELEKVAKSAV